MSNPKDDMAPKKGEPRQPKVVVEGKRKVRPGPLPLGEAVRAGQDPDAKTQHFTARQAQERIAEAESHAVVSGAVDETLSRELEAAAWAPIGGTPEPATEQAPAAGGRLGRRPNPRSAAARAARGEALPTIEDVPPFDVSGLARARTAAEAGPIMTPATRMEGEPTEHDHPLDISAVPNSIPDSDGAVILEDFPEAHGAQLHSIDVRGDKASTSYSHHAESVLDAGVMEDDGDFSGFLRGPVPPVEERAVSQLVSIPGEYPALDDDTEDATPPQSAPLPMSGRTPVRLNTAPAREPARPGTPAPEGTSDDMYAAYSGLAAASGYAERMRTVEAPTDRLPVPGPAPEHTTTQAPVIPRAEAPTVPMPPSPRPPEASHTVERPAAEGTPRAALAEVARATADRERVVLDRSPWKRRIFIGLVAVGAAALAAVGADAWFGRNNQHEATPATDVASAHETAGAQPQAPENLPVAPEKVKAVEHSVPIKNGQGVSQALLSAGVPFDQMMQGLKLNVTIGDRTGQLKDTFVIAKGGDLGLTVKQDASGTVTGVDFYKVGAEGAVLTPTELSKYLALADWRAINAEKAATGRGGTAQNDLDLLPKDPYERFGGLSDSSAQAYAEGTFGSNTDSVDIRDLHRYLDASSGQPATGVDLGDSTELDTGLKGVDAGFHPESQIPERFRANPHMYDNLTVPMTPFVPVSLEPDAPTLRVEPPVLAPAAPEVAPARTFHMTPDGVQYAQWMPQMYERHMESLEDRLDATPGRTTHMGNLEFRRVGLRTPEYQIRFNGESQWAVLDSKMMERLNTQYDLDFRDPEAMRSIDKVHFASLLPDGHPTKEALRKNLETMIVTLPNIGYDAAAFKAQYKQLTGHDFETATARVEEAPTETITR